MPRRSPIPNAPSSRQAATRPAPEPDETGGAWAVRLGEWLRRLALGLTAALVTARAYWPSEPDLKGEAASGLDWALAMLLVLGLALASALVGGRLRLRWSWADAAVVALFLAIG